jgi:hypothetical protein
MPDINVKRTQGERKQWSMGDTRLRRARNIDRWDLSVMLVILRQVFMERSIYGSWMEPA